MLGEELAKALKEKGLTKYRRAAQHAAIKYWEGTGKNDELIFEAVERGITTAQLIKENENG